jgi:hypothetical protein
MNPKESYDMKVKWIPLSVLVAIIITVGIYSSQQIFTPTAAADTDVIADTTAAPSTGGTPVQCSPFNGYFTSNFDSDIAQPYPPGYVEHCPNSTLFPVKQCTHGKLYPDRSHTTDADIIANYEFSFTSQTANPLLGRLDYTGDSVVTMKATGTVIKGHDKGWLKPNPTTSGQASFQTDVAPYLKILADGTTSPLWTAETHPKTYSYIIAGPNGSGVIDLATFSSGDYIGQICPKL